MGQPQSRTPLEKERIEEEMDDKNIVQENSEEEGMPPLTDGVLPDEEGAFSLGEFHAGGIPDEEASSSSSGLGVLVTSDCDSVAGDTDTDADASTVAARRAPLGPARQSSTDERPREKVPE